MLRPRPPCFGAQPFRVQTRREIVPNISCLTYAIGDVHGRADLLADLLAAIAEDAEQRGQPPRVIFLGDLVDRGPDSPGVLDLVARTLERWPGSRLVLGNHDDAFVHVVRGDPPEPLLVEHWLANGGTAVVRNYAPSGDMAEALQVVRTRFPHHLDLLEQAALMVVDGDFAFVHAGIDPRRALDAQRRHDILTIRYAFLDHPGPLPRVVVHGHTPTQARIPELHPYRIALDTGAFATGRLSAVVLDPRAADIAFLATVPGRAHGVETLAVAPADAVPVIW